MSDMVQVALAEDITEAEELQAILEAAGIESVLETAVEHHPKVIAPRPKSADLHRQHAPREEER